MFPPQPPYFPSHSLLLYIPILHGPIHYILSDTVFLLKRKSKSIDVSVTKLEGRKRHQHKKVMTYISQVFGANFPFSNINFYFAEGFVPSGSIRGRIEHQVPSLGVQKNHSSFGPKLDWFGISNFVLCTFKTFCRLFPIYVHPFLHVLLISQHEWLDLQILVKHLFSLLNPIQNPF